MPPPIKLKPLPLAASAISIEHARKLATNGTPAFVEDSHGTFEKLVVLPAGVFEEHLRIIKAAEFFDRIPAKDRAGFILGNFATDMGKGIPDLLEHLADKSDEIAKELKLRNIPIVGKKNAPFRKKRSIPKQK